MTAQRMPKWLTCTEVRLAASTQDGIKLRLVGSHFVFPGGVQFLLPKQTCQNGKRNVTRQANDCLLLFEHHTNVPEHPAGPGRCQQSLFHHDFPKQGQTHTQCSFSSRQIKRVCNEIISWEAQRIYLAERDKKSAEVTRGVAADGVLQALPVLWKRVWLFNKTQNVLSGALR